MPRYLRWIAAMTAGISAYFAYSFLSFALTSPSPSGVRELRGASGALAAFGLWVVTMVATLGVNDWIARTYPMQPKRPPEHSTHERIDNP